jgi:hypothetical protein
LYLIVTNRVSAGLASFDYNTSGMAGVATAAYSADALPSPAGVDGSQWDFAVPLGNEVRIPYVAVAWKPAFLCSGMEARE